MFKFRDRDWGYKVEKIGVISERRFYTISPSQMVKWNRRHLNNISNQYIRADKKTALLYYCNCRIKYIGLMSLFLVSEPGEQSNGDK